MLEYIKACLRIAWRHSWERSQSVTAILWVGINAAAWKWPWLVSYASGGKITEINDWALAAILFGGIIVLRLLLAPYWAWKEMKAERDAALSELELPKVADLDIAISQSHGDPNWFRKAIKYLLEVGTSFRNELNLEFSLSKVAPDYT